ncbi:hypothetical protein MTX78_24165 (plasmid) [Hymenobacter tibetensis]|uniref:Uncharacterized protein n=1 Tax=Hymenobacter tibetensis TaxID=497967 RepID=A0ABY4DBS6_9BACT|nr:hypothetical protein [Hymenobacter tibetensis]UOG77528.1 hypothetical protein MTX78_24165 [Hymenobacter tibetensis]
MLAKALRIGSKRSSLSCAWKRPGRCLPVAFKDEPEQTVTAADSAVALPEFL